MPQEVQRALQPQLFITFVAGEHFQTAKNASPSPQAEPKTSHLTHEDPEMLQPHPLHRTFIPPCLNQPVKPIHPDPQALEGGGLAARLG